MVVGGIVPFRIILLTEKFKKKKKKKHESGTFPSHFICTSWKQFCNRTWLEYSGRNKPSVDII